MSRLRRFRLADQRGQILVIVAGGFIGLLAFAALALEGGTLVLNRRDGQNAADLASVVGARIVGLNYTDNGRTQADVYGAVGANLDLNNCGAAASAPCTWAAEFVGAGLVNLGPVANATSALPSGALGVRVGVTRTPGTVLGRVLNISSWTVSTEATAVAAKPPSVGAGTMLPIALCGWGTVGNNDCEPATSTNAIVFQPGQVYDLTDGKDAPGGFGWLSWDGSNSAPSLSASVCTPNNPAFTLDSAFDSPGDYDDKVDPIGTNPGDGETWFPVGPGKMNSSAMRSCLDGWISTGATVLIPIYDTMNSTANGQNAGYHITGVAAFVLTAREQPAVDQIQGYFVEYFPLSDVPGGSGWTPPAVGDQTIFIGLVR